MRAGGLWFAVVVISAFGSFGCGDPSPSSVDARLDAAADAGGDAGVDAGADADADAAVDAAVDAAADAASPDAVPAFCGDNNVDPGEACDDGNDQDGDGCASTCRTEAPLPMRVVAANLTSGNFQNYDLGHGQRILQALVGDVVLIQEFNVGDGSEAALRGFVDATFGPTFAFAREPAGAGDIPNGVISRWPIVAWGEVDDPEQSNRDFVWAQIDLPNTDLDLWAVSVHLSTDAGKRAPEARALVDFVAATVPAEAYLVIGGDLNTDDRDESALTTLGEVVGLAAPYPSDQNANDSTNANRNKPYDWVLFDSDIDPLRAATVFGTFTFANGLVFDTREFTALELSDSFAPAQLTDSGAPSMQHMAVVRDVIIPAR